MTFTLSPDLVDQLGGATIILTGTFTRGEVYRAYMGPLGTSADPPCHSAIPGDGFDCLTEDETTLRIVAPAVANGSESDQFVTLVHPIEGTASQPITVIESPHYSTVFSLRREFPPFQSVGSRRLELEPRRWLV